MMEVLEQYFVDDYRFGFNGQEKDDEIKGSGNSLNYKYRMQDVRIGRFLSVDPLAKSYPFYSPYHFAGNTPIWASDLEGLEPDFKHDVQILGTELSLKLRNMKSVQGEQIAATAKAVGTGFNSVVQNGFAPELGNLGDAFLQSLSHNNFIKSAGFRIKETQALTSFGAIENETKIFGKSENGLTINNTLSAVANANTSNVINPAASFKSNAEIGLFVDLEGQNDVKEGLSSRSLPIQSKFGIKKVHH